MRNKASIVFILTIMLLTSACKPATPTVASTKAPVAEPTSTAAPVVQPTNTSVPTAEPASAASAPADASAFPPAEIANDEGGPALVTGEWNYTSAYVGRHYFEPVPILLNMSRQIQGNYTDRPLRDEQVIGTLTRPLAPAPTAFKVNIPVQPEGASVDVDNDGEQDAGVQIYAAVIGSNLSGDSYLEQVEQEGFPSYLQDPQTGAMREGTFLVYAPDDQQGFPENAGADGVFFTEDDPAVKLPSGYTLATLTSDGKVGFDRSGEVSMDIREAAAYQSPDFSKQGILESYNSLIDMLKQRYSYTKLRGLDWEKIHQEYLPKVEAADQAEDFAAYYSALNELALSIRDAHVYLFTTDSSLSNLYKAQIAEAYGGDLGANILELSDGRFVLNYLDPEGPGAKAGWQVGTEILSVDGVPIGERVETLPLLESTGNPEIIRLKQSKFALAFPVGAETTIEYLQPGESQPRSAVLTASEPGDWEIPGPPVEEETISYKALDDGSYYVQWKAFDDDLYKVTIWEKFLQQAADSPGIIIDLRKNGGGGLALLYTLASYLFPAEKPAPEHWIDSYTFDDKVGDLVKEFSTDYMLSSPKPELTYYGAIVALVGEGSASAAEYLPQFLQSQGRAIVVGEHGTEGAGGALETVRMPGNFTFNFTKGRSTFAGTDELNLEAKGVTLDVRVPITLEKELAKQEGRDVVLEAAKTALGEEVARRVSENLPGTSWQLVFIQETSGKTPIGDPTAYTISFDQGGQMAIKADCNQAQAEYQVGSGGSMTITLGPTTLAACPEGSLSDKFLELLGNVIALQTDGKNILLTADVEGSFAALLLQRAE